MLLKKSSCVFLPASLLLHASVLLLCRCDAVDDYTTVVGVLETVLKAGKTQEEFKAT